MCVFKEVFVFLHNHLHKYEYYGFTGSDTAKRDIYSYRRSRCFHPRHKEEAADTSEAFVPTYQYTRRHFPEYIFIFTVVRTSNVTKKKRLQKTLLQYEARYASRNKCMETMSNTRHVLNPPPQTGVSMNNILQTVILTNRSC